jgi:hypothetical protein
MVPMISLTSSYAAGSMVSAATVGCWCVAGVLVLPAVATCYWQHAAVGPERIRGEQPDAVADIEALRNGKRQLKPVRPAG